MLPSIALHTVHKSSLDFLTCISSSLIKQSKLTVGTRYVLSFFILFFSNIFLIFSNVIFRIFAHLFKNKKRCEKCLVRSFRGWGKRSSQEVKVFDPSSASCNVMKGMSYDTALLTLSIIQSFE